MADYVGILTAGGDSPGLNAAIRGVGKATGGAYSIVASVSRRLPWPSAGPHRAPGPV